jgi:hypothetical protein
MMTLSMAALFDVSGKREHRYHLVTLKSAGKSAGRLQLFVARAGVVANAVAVGLWTNSFHVLDLF